MYLGVNDETVQDITAHTTHSRFHYGVSYLIGIIIVGFFDKMAYYSDTVLHFCCFLILNKTSFVIFRKCQIFCKCKINGIH